MVGRLATRWQTLLLVLILALGAGLRLYGLDWDDGHWLHPDERQIYFVTLGLDWPHSLTEALSPDSPLNPQFFAYGSLPFYLLKLVAAVLAPLWPALRDPDNLHLAGRPLAVLFDLGTIYLTYRLARSLLPPLDRDGPAWGAILAAALTGLAVLHVQLGHFYTVDPLLTFFIMLTLALAAGVAKGASQGHQIALGLALGLALATKVSAAPLLLVIFVAYYFRYTVSSPHPPNSRAQFLTPLRKMLPTLLLAGAIFVMVQPYVLIDWPTFLDHTFRESQIAWGVLDVPYTRQYGGTLPYLYSLRQTATWALALPVGLIALAGLAAALIRWVRRAPWSDSLLLAWAGPYLAITGLLYTRYLRYMLPLIPVLCILGTYLLTDLGQRQWFVTRRWVLRIGCWALGIGSLAYALSFALIYAAPHTWIAASEWLYREAPAGSTLAVEDWDVALPLPLEVDGHARRIEEYDVRVLTLYDEPDDADKWEALASDLAGSDYVILASRRLYGSIPRLPERYPIATRYYDQLLAENLGFELVGEFTRGPEWLNPPIPPLPDAAPTLLQPDESLVVYDHPRTLIFHNTERLPAVELLHRLGLQ